MPTSFPLRLGLALPALVLACHASAAIVTSRAGLGGDDYIDWGQVPVALDAGGAHAITAPFSATSNLGLSAQVSNPPLPGMWRVVQAGGVGCPGFQFASNFAPCDAVLLSANNNNALNRISIQFASPVAGGGAQFSDAASYGNFTATLAAFDASDVLLESWSLAGTTNGAANDSAVFLGISRLQADISRLDFSSVGFNRYFGINRVELDRTAPDPPGTVPEPSTLLSVLLALPLALRARRKAQRRPA